MGQSKNGPFSGHTGRTGGLVGSRKNGKWILAVVKATAPKPPTVLQQYQQIKLGMITQWLSSIDSFIRLGFAAYDSEMSAWNAAVKYNLLHAVGGVGPAFNIVYADALLSRGSLDGAELGEVSAVTAGELEFSWSANVGEYNGHATDKAVLLVYNPMEGKFVMVKGAVTRATLSYTMLLPSAFSGDTVHAYMAFVSADGKGVSTSDYLGSAIVL